MIRSFYIAWRYVVYHKIKSGILIVSIACILFMPIALRTLVRACERQLMARAQSTPLLVGAKGSSLDLAVGALYFQPKQVESIRMSELRRVESSGTARAIPLYTRFRARGHTIVGTTLDYFAFRGLSLSRGRQMTRLGDCVLGAAAADGIGLGPGDHLLSSPENLFDLAGTYPLNLRVAGVFHASHTPDDLAVFVDLKTAWVIEGLGHGHQDLVTIEDSAALLDTSRRTLTADARLFQYNEITGDNIDSFHFHGDTSDFPITAVIAVAYDRKSASILQGRYQMPDEACQIFRPIDVIRDLTGTIFKIEGALNWAFALTGAATLLLVALVVMLSLRLRSREIQTMIRLGCGRLKMVELLSAELLIVGAASAGVTAAAATIASIYVDDFLRRLIL